VLFFLHLESRRVTLGGSRPSPNLNAFAERWVRSVRQECLSKLILFGEGALQRALNEFIEHFQLERNHHGKGNVLLVPDCNDDNVRSPYRLQRTPRRPASILTSSPYLRAAS
jgi:hypothetical protein